jgi:two-component system CheB/CheR fusion protein
MNNLLAGTGMGTVFVDNNMNILRFTPAITKTINLIQSDVGRPVSHILSNFKTYDNLMNDIQEVLETLVHKEFDVETQVGTWYTTHIQPYRTLDNIIEGAVITFVDISRAKDIERKFIHSQMRYSDLINIMNLIFLLVEIIFDEKGQPFDYFFREVNPSFERLVGKTKKELLNKRFREIFSTANNTLLELYNTVSTSGSLVNFEKYVDEFTGFYRINAWMTEDNLLAVSLYDINEQKKMENELDRSR